MRGLLFKNKRYIVLMLSFIIIEPSINSVLNFWMQRLFNAAAPGVDRVIILRLLTYGFLLWMIKRVVSFSSGVFKARYKCKARQEMKREMFSSLLQMETSNIVDIASSGEYISLFTNDISIIEQRFFDQILSLVSSIVSIIILGSSFLALNVTLSGAILAFGVLSMFVPIAFSKNLNRKNLEYSNSVSKFTQTLKEYFSAFPTVKNYSIESEILTKFNVINGKTENSKFEADYALTLANSVGQLLSWFMQFIGVGIGLMLVVKGEISIGTVVAAQAFASDLAMPLQNTIISINSIRSVKEIVKKSEALSTGSISQSPSTNCDTLRASVMPVLAGDIVFDDLYLEINRQKIVDHFSFTFVSGKKYLIVGTNGAGKSSLFKSLKKWFNNTKGAVYIGERNIRTLQSKDISAYVSYLNENVSMFSGSVRDNITLSRSYSTESFEKAIEDAQVNVDLDRKIGDEGRNISSGEQRRIEIARSLLASAQVLILDEVVSTLDIETAYEIEKLVLSFKDKTVIFVSHNFSGKLVHMYDDILVMNKGKLLAHGTYDELRQACDYFNRICEIKFG